MSKSKYQIEERIRPAGWAQPALAGLFRAVLESVILLSLLSGCTVGPDYKRPETEVPAQWSGVAPPDAAVPGGLADEGELARW